eukprot:9168259-Alexandrium_andersonii.AAC.1
MRDDFPAMPRVGAESPKRKALRMMASSALTAAEVEALLADMLARARSGTTPERREFTMSA